MFDFFSRGFSRKDPHHRLTDLLTRAEQLLANKPPEAISVAYEARGLARAMPDETSEIRALLILGKAEYAGGNLKAALSHLEQAMAMALSPRQAAEVELLSGRAQRDLGEVEAASKHLICAIEICQAEGFSDIHADALNGLAGVQYTQGHYADALITLNKALEIIRFQDQPAQEAKVLNNIAQIFTRLGNYGAALEHLLQALSKIRLLPDRAHNEASYLLSIGTVHQKMGNLIEAQECFVQARSIGRVGGNFMVEAAALNNLANVCVLREEWNHALQHFKNAMAMAKTLGNKNFEVDNLDGLGQVLRIMGQHPEAIRAHQDALAIARAISDSEGVIEALLNLGRDYLEVNKTVQGLEATREALALAERQGRKEAEYQAHQLLSQTHKAMGNLEEALTHHEAYAQARDQVLKEQSLQRSQMFAAQYALESARRERSLMQQLWEESQTRIAERTAELEQTQLELLDCLATLSDGCTHPEHSFRVAEYAARIAVALGWASEQVELLRRATLLHDIGKVVIADNLLSKPHPLGPEATTQVQQHTTFGADLLSKGKMALMQMAQQIALSHHEHWDGQGHPLGLCCEQIPLTARIVAVADAYDALTHDRVYRRARSPEEARAEISAQIGKQFDPEVVLAALRVLS